MFSFCLPGIRNNLFEISFRKAILPEYRLVNYILMCYSGFARADAKTLEPNLDDIEIKTNCERLELEYEGRRVSFISGMT